MPRYEYKAVPAPRKGLKARGVKTPEDRFANAMSDLMNRMAADGWDYLRADTLPADERTGWTGKTAEVSYNILVFRREITANAPIPVEDPEETRLPRFAATRADPPPAPAIRLGPAREEIQPE